MVAGLVSFLTGIAGMMGAPVDDFQNNTHDHSAHSHEDLQNSEQNFTLGSAHEHAQFFLNVNGSEEEFADRKYQLQSRYVHLENFKPHIVHKHSENVTWIYFLETINVEAGEKCVKFKGNEQCGNVSITLNGEEVDSLDQEIQQGDKLAIITPPNTTIAEKYREKELPDDYTKEVEGRTI